MWRLWVRLRHASGTAGGYCLLSAEATICREGWHLPRALRLLDALQTEFLSFKTDD